jgi:WXXGXW repeat (2 copies)
MRIARSLRLLLFTLGIFFTLALAAPSYSQLAVGIRVTIAPPELPVYDQPVCPGDGYLWTPGYWDWDSDDNDYFWVPGTWVLAPEPGFFWTPGYWGWNDGAYLFNAGYWGPAVGFYGGINYGFGFFGVGFVGGRWDGGHFFYNRAFANINAGAIHNVYEDRVNVTNVTRVSFNGGNGGINARPTAAEEAAARDRHVGPVAAQTQHVQEARGNRELRASVNHGAPVIAATAKPGDFRTGVVKTREAGRVNEAPANARAENNARPENNAHPEDHAAPDTTPAHARDIPSEKPPAPNTGNPKLDQKYQKQQDQLAAKQDQQRQKLQQQQDKEHQQADKQKSSAAQRQQMEQKHQQQTSNLRQRQQQERQQLQQRQAPAPHAAPAKPH